MVSTPGDLKAIEQRNFGRYWQTVRAGTEIALKPPLPHLAAQLDDLRARHPEKGVYGGSGWANYAAAYFNDCQRFCALTLPCMRPGGVVVVVIGNNILQGIEFQTDRLFAEIAGARGIRDRAPARSTQQANRNQYRQLFRACGHGRPARAIV